MNARYSGKCARCGTSFSKGTDIYSDNKRWYVVNCQGCEKRKVDLTGLLYAMASPGPGTDGKTYVEITCICEFEAYCHDSWGLRWRVTLPLMKSYINWSGDWESGWKLGSSDKPFSCESETMSAAISKTIGFLCWYNSQEEGL